MTREIQYPQLQGVVEAPLLFVRTPPHVETLQVQVWPLRRAQQPPGYVAPATDPLVIPRVPPHVETLQVQVWPLRRAQQPPSLTMGVTTPAPAAVPTWFNMDQAQKRPRRWAQQPGSDVGPVMVIPAAVSTRRRFGQII